MSIKAPATKSEFMIASLLTVFLAAPVFVEVSLYSLISLVVALGIGFLAIAGALKHIKKDINAGERI